MAIRDSIPFTHVVHWVKELSVCGGGWLSERTRASAYHGTPLMQDLHLRVFCHHQSSLEFCQVQSVPFLFNVTLKARVIRQPATEAMQFHFSDD